MKKNNIIKIVLISICLIIAILIGMFYMKINTGPFKNENGHKVYYENGKKIINNAVEIDGVKYYFDENGYMVINNWYKSNDGFEYFIDENSNILIDTITSDGSCVDIDGKRVVNGLVKSNNGTFKYFSNGEYAKDKAVTIDTNNYYFDENGNMIINSWKEVAGKRHYYTENGTMAINGWVTDINDGKMYYMDKNGDMLTNTMTPDGKFVDVNGAYDEVKTKEMLLEVKVDKKKQFDLVYPIIEISIKDFGKIELKLDSKNAPITVNNFINLVNSGFYDGLTFHRIIKGFMIQGGDPNGDGTGGSDKTIKGEFKKNGITNNISHKRGVISMARSNKFDSASSQFFICQEDSKYLDGNYAAFGEVTSGIEVVDKIANTIKAVDNNGTVRDKDKPLIEYIKVVG